MSMCYYRERMESSYGKQCYDRLLAYLERNDLSGNYLLPDNGAADACDRALEAAQALQMDRPEFFFLGKCMRATRNGQRKELRLTVNILYSLQTVKQVRQRLASLLNELCRGLQALPQWEKEREIYTRLRRKLTYRDNGKPYDHNIVGPLLQGSGVCEGFSHLLTLALRHVGIPCIMVRDPKLRHRWNVAWIEGKPYHLDITWESLSDRGDLLYSHFNLTDRQRALEDGCKASDGPHCTDSNGNYHVRKGSSFANETQLQKALLSALHRGNGPYGLRLQQGNIEAAIKKALEKAPTGRMYYYRFHKEQGVANVWAVPVRSSSGRK